MAEPTPTYHVDIWTVPDPTYVCVFCLPSQRYTLEEVTTHLREVHHADAIPTPNMDQLLALRTASDQRAAEAAAAMPTPGAQPPAAPAPESQAEAPGDAATPPDDTSPAEATHASAHPATETSAPARPEAPEELPHYG